MANKLSVSTKTKTELSALVIGGTGFIGSHIVESLLAQNVAVTVIDEIKGGNLDNLNRINKNKGFTFIEHDINKPLPLDNPQFSYIFHIGGIEAFLNGNDVSIDNLLVSSIGMHNALELARSTNAKFLLVSLLDIYNGMMSSLELKNYFGLSERDNNRYSHYEAKRYAEALLSEYYRKYNLDARIVRISDVYGPHMNLEAGTECAQLITEALVTDSLTIHGDGLKIIHPTYISDVVVGITKAMFTNGTSGKIYNVINKDEVNILNLAYAIQKNSTKPLKIQFTQEYLEINFPIHQVELAQTEHDLSWRAKTGLSEGITATLEYFFLKQAEKNAQLGKVVDKVDNKKDNEKELKKEVQKEVQAPLISAVPLKTEKVEIKLEKVAETEVKKTKTKKNKSPIINLTIVALSFFIVLMMFIFPITTLFITSGWVINESKNAITLRENNTLLQEATLKSLKYNTLASAQFDSLEWFFNLTKKREEYENTRSKLQALDMLDKALIAVNDDAKLENKTISEILTGESDPEKVQLYFDQFKGTILDLQKSALDTESTNQTFFSSTQKVGLGEINTQAESLLNSLQDRYTRNQLLLGFLTPQQDRVVNIIIFDNSKATQYGGKPIGFMHNILNKAGISKFEFTSFIDDQNIATPSEAATQIQKSTGINADAYYYINNTVLVDLLKQYGPVTLTRYADVVNKDNVSSKLSQGNAEYQISVWREVFKNIKDSNDSFDQLGKTLVNNIKEENIKMFAVDSSNSLSIIPCSQGEMLYTLITLKELQKNASYCISLTEEQKTTQLSTDITKKINLTHDDSNQLRKYKLTFNLSNQSDAEVIEDINIGIPTSTKLTNVQIVFPISFDKIKSQKKDDQNIHTFSVNVLPESAKDVIIEWEDTAPQIADQNIYLQKPLGSYIEQVSIDTSSAPLTIKNQSLMYSPGQK
jgi:nucleoside-diphosphate-sugar epimerase